MNEMTERRRFFQTSAVPVRYNGLTGGITMAYEIYGQLNSAKDNAILIVHGFSADSHVAAHDAADRKGWWEWAVGPGRPLDTDRYYIVCANNLGSCFGSSGPTTVSPVTGQTLGPSFPYPTMEDIVFCQMELQQHLGVSCWQAVIGGSLGGMAALQWMSAFPSRVATAICLNAGIRLSHMGRGLMDIQADMLRLGGAGGLHLARRLATLSFVHEEYFLRRHQAEGDWQLTSWLTEEARDFACRFDPLSYAGFLHAMTAFECHPSQGVQGRRVIIVGSEEDILFPPSLLRETSDRFAPFAYVTLRILSSPCGHDAFLLDEEQYAPILREIFGPGSGAV